MGYNWGINPVVEEGVEMRKEVKINLRIDKAEWERFKQIARREDLSASQMIRRCVRRILSRDQGPGDPKIQEDPRVRRGRRKEG